MSGNTEWRQADEIFDRLIDLPSSERQAALSRMALDPAVAARVERLLVAHEGPPGILDVTPASVPALSHADSMRGRRFGAWQIEQEIGRGGMSVVYRVHDTRQPERVAALKLITLGSLVGAGIERFEREQSILARLSHPNIVPLFEAGTSEDGTPWLVMALVDGQRIDDWCQARALDRRARVALVLEVCDAVSHAHQSLIIHRDVKPSNVLVSAQGKVRLLDFGIARIADESSDRTHSAYRALTPGYAAPEQFSGAPAATTMDVYGLGALLHTVLLGRAPHDAGDTHDERPGPHRDREALPTDLDAIVRRALAPEPADRYESARALRDDLVAWLDDRPVSARRSTRRYRLRKFIARHRMAMAAAVLVTTSLVVGLAGTLWQAQRAQRAALAAEQARVRAEASRDFLARLFRATVPTRPSQSLPGTEELLAEGARRALRVADDDAVLGLDLAATLGSVYVQRRMTSEADPLVARALALADRLGTAEPALHVRAYVLAAMRSYLDRDFARAADRLAAAAALAPHLDRFHPAILELRFAQAWIDYAQQRPEAAVERLAPLWAELRVRPEVDPDDAIRVANTLALALEASGAGAASSDVYDDILSIAERSYGRDHLNWAIPAVNAGSNAFNAGNFERAATLFAAGIHAYDAIRAEPMEQRATARSLQGLMWLATGQLDAAREAMTAARSEWAALRGADDTSRDPVLAYRLGMVDAVAGRWREAVEAQQRALALPWPAGRGGEFAQIDVTILLADARCATRDVAGGEAAIADARARIAANADYTDARWLAWLEQAAARCALARQAPADALAALTRAAAHDADIGRGHLSDLVVRQRLHAAALEALGRDEEATRVRADASAMLRVAGMAGHPVEQVALLVDAATTNRAAPQSR